MATRVSEHTSVAQLASTSSSVLSSLANSLRDYELDKHDQEELHGENYLRFPVFGQYVLLLRRGLAKSQGHVYLEKRTNLPGFQSTYLFDQTFIGAASFLSQSLQL